MQLRLALVKNVVEMQRLNAVEVGALGVTSIPRRSVVIYIYIYIVSSIFIKRYATKEGSTINYSVQAGSTAFSNRCPAR